MQKCRDGVEERGIVDHSRYLGLVSATLCVNCSQRNQQCLAGLIRFYLWPAHCCMNQTCTTLPAPRSPIILISGFVLSLARRLWTKEQNPWYYCQDPHRSAGATWGVAETFCPWGLGLGWLREPAWIPQACWQAATLPSAGVCGAVLGGRWMCQRVMSGGLCERERHTHMCVYMWGCVCVCMHAQLIFCSVNTYICQERRGVKSVQRLKKVN